MADLTTSTSVLIPGFDVQTPVTVRMMDDQRYICEYRQGAPWKRDELDQEMQSIGFGDTVEQAKAEFVLDAQRRLRGHA